ncbi:uncharacterized protein LOC106639069 [Copidosoma floridanum]|uniref:uncharacterized protein LOC106639069 n=1 Tax=Copidosoma floridanum TaxID=29053 RepID=UPI0006C97277|nr:uncharacterized protein LOC106639069 [Copidosoma floridanum]
MIPKSSSLSFVIAVLVFYIVEYSSAHIKISLNKHRSHSYATLLARNQQNFNVQQTNVEWVCTNPKTNDMMIITSEDAPRFGGQSVPQPWTQSNYPQVQIPTHNQPIKVQPVDPQTQQWAQTGSQINPTYQKVANIPINVGPTQNPQPIVNDPQQYPKNTDGDGLIDIRMGH